MATARDVLRELKNKPLLFGKVVNPDAFTVPSSFMHYELEEIFKDDSARKVVIQAPRGTAKSTIVGGVFALHHLMFEDRVPTKFVLLVSRTEGHSKKLLQTIADIIEYSPNFRKIFGYWGRHSARKWAEREIILKDGSIIMARGINQQIVGLKQGNQRPTLAILDDPEDLTNTKTPEAMENNMAGLLKVIVPALDAKIGKVWVIGTPQKQDCMVEKLMTMPGWTARKYDSIIDEKTHKVLWPEMHSWEKLMQEKEALESIGKLSIFYSEYRCQIIGDEEQLFKPQYLRYWDGEFFIEDGYPYLRITKLGKSVKQGIDYVPEFTEYDPPLVIPVNTFMGIDPASSVKSTADFSVVMPIAVDAEKNIYVLPYFRGRVTPMMLASKIIEYYRTYYPEWTNIETVGYQEMLRDYLRSSEEVEYIPGLEKKNSPKTPKSTRLESMEIDFYKGKVYIKEDMDALRDELLLYPRAKHDDTIDALWYAKRKIWAPAHEWDGEKTKEEKFFFRKRRGTSWLTA